MQVTAGHFSLTPLLEFAKTHPTIPSGTGNQTQTDSLALRERVTAEVPDWPGWHMWGRFDETGRWRPVFVGQTKGGKASVLNLRLREMLSDERTAFWAEIYGVEPIIAQVLKIYSRYENESRVSARKAPARFVVWAGVQEIISTDEVKRQGRLLIDHYGPLANTVRGAGKYAPDALTHSIAAAMDSEVVRIDPRS